MLWKSLRVFSCSLTSSAKKSSSRCLSSTSIKRNNSQVEDEDSERFNPKPTEPVIFPSFSTSGKFGADFIRMPTPFSILEFTGYGECHKHEFAPNYKKATGQSGKEVYEGTKFAVEEVTKLMSTYDEENDDKLKGCVTNACYLSLKRTLQSDERLQEFQKKRLLSIPQGDMLFSWINHLKENDEGYEALLCIISFPGFERLQKINSVLKEEKRKFQEDLRGKISSENLKKPDFMRMVEDFKRSQPDINPYLMYMPIVLSNFRFVRGENDTWLVDEIKMMHAADVFSKYRNFRWRGRVGVSFKGPGITVGQAIRYDWFTDYMICSLFFIYLLQLLITK